MAERGGKGIERLATVAVAFAAAEASVMNVSFPTLRLAFAGRSGEAVSWVLIAYPIVYAAFLIIAGRLADEFGRVRVFRIGLWVCTAGTGLAAAAVNLEVLVFARTVQGVGAALWSPAALALVLANATGGERSKRMGQIVGAQAVAVTCGPLFGALAVTLSGWRAAFVLQLPILLLLLVRSKGATNAGPKASGRLPDVPGSILLATAGAVLSLAIVRGHDWGWTSPRVLVAFLVAGASGFGVVRRGRTHASPALSISLFQSSAFTTASAATAVFGAAFLGNYFAAPLFFSHIWGYRPAVVGVAILPPAVLIAYLAPRAGALAGRIGYRALAVPGTVLFALGLLWYGSQARPDADYLRSWLPGAVLVGAGVGMAMPVLNAAALHAVRPAQLAEAGGVVQMARQLGGALGVAALFGIIGQGNAMPTLESFQTVWLLFVVVAACAGLVTLALPGRAPAAVLDKPLGHKAR